MGVGSISTLEIDAIQPTQAAMEHFAQWVKDNPPAPLEVPVVVDPLEELKGTADGIAEAFGAASGALSQFASESKELHDCGIDCHTGGTVCQHPQG